MKARSILQIVGLIVVVLGFAFAAMKKEMFISCGGGGGRHGGGGHAGG